MRRPASAARIRAIIARFRATPCQTPRLSVRTRRPLPGRRTSATLGAAGAADSGGPGAPPPAGLPRGFAIGRYVVLERIGLGGMGAVYAAYDPELDRRVALKVLRRPAQHLEGQAADGAAGPKEAAGRQRPGCWPRRARWPGSSIPTSCGFTTWAAIAARFSSPPSCWSGST